MKASIVGFFLIAIPFFISGCRQPSTPTRIPETTSESEEGFYDLLLAIEEHQDSDTADTPNGELTISFRYQLEESGRRLRATERLRGAGREQDNALVFDRSDGTL